jgi:intracellular sulfur oxidation DsrE/DsrF family protein
MIRLPTRRDPARYKATRRLFAATLGAALLTAAVWTTTAQAADEKKPHRVAFQVNVNDPATMNLALNNLVNIATYYSGKGEQVEIELVAYGPGLHMLRDDTSPVKARLKSISESLHNVTFSACNNTRESMAKNEGKDIPIVSQAKVVPSGVVRLVELQEGGWSYIRP